MAHQGFGKRRYFHEDAVRNAEMANAFRDVDAPQLLNKRFRIDQDTNVEAGQNKDHLSGKRDFKTSQLSEVKVPQPLSVSDYLALFKEKRI